MKNPYADPRPLTLEACRQQAALLLEQVTDEQISPRIALNNWPFHPKWQDPTLEIAYQALWHFEADEEKQKTELFYMDMQLELLRQMGRILAKGQALPDHLVRYYSLEHRARYYGGEFLPKSLWRQCLHYWQTIRKILLPELSIYPPK
jgi:hypothetical protein